ncbi:Protein REPRESSOR OF SILENCING 3 [Ranunculus cassubicifolius]
MEERGNVEESLMNEEEKRIFVGGLGDKVTEDDLCKTFSSLGTIKAVDFVTTNGRCFAYIDFQPSSTKSLPKLFSSVSTFF